LTQEIGDDAGLAHKNGSVMPVLLQGVSLPDDARRTLVAKCADCHPNATHWPIYSTMAQISWMIERDVVQGRSHLNLSDWKELPPDRLQDLAQEIVHQAKSDTMPPLPYRMMHWHAALGPSDRAALARLVPAGTKGPAVVAAGDAERGRAVFGRRCTGCHAVDSDREGPHLRGVYGRRAGSLPGFAYSPAIRNSGVTWSDVTLERWLSDSDAMVPGSAMGFSVPKPQERSDLIVFLRSLR
jgi:cytochrome c